MGQGWSWAKLTHGVAVGSWAWAAQHCSRCADVHPATCQGWLPFQHLKGMHVFSLIRDTFQGSQIPHATCYSCGMKSLQLLPVHYSLILTGDQIRVSCIFWSAVANPSFRTQCWLPWLVLLEVTWAFTVTGTPVHQSTHIHRHLLSPCSKLLGHLILHSHRFHYQHLSTDFSNTNSAGTSKSQLKLSACILQVLVLNWSPVTQQESSLQTDHFYLLHNNTWAQWGLSSRRNLGSRSEDLFCRCGFKWDPLALFEPSVADSSFNHILILICLCSHCFPSKSETTGRRSNLLNL